jgi:hypothetical protein
MSELHTIFSGREELKRNNVETATKRDFQRENAQRAEISQIVADLVKKKTSWLSEPRGIEEYVRGWAGLR